MTYLFILGNTPGLAKAEVESVLTQKGISFTPVALVNNYFLLDTQKQIETEILGTLGGTVKVALIFSSSVEEELSKDKKPNERISFGISGDAPAFRSKEIKSNLEELGYKVRFVLPPKGEMQLSSVVVKKQNLTEIYLLNMGGKSLCARTIWVQDFEDWGKRDYGRPAAAAHVGMLPPKVARIMVNLGSSDQVLGSSILDPFCGVGTIAAESLTLGIKTIATDINPKQVQNTKDNLDWLIKTYNLEPGQYQTFVCNAANVSRKIPVNSIDAIITEPDLGPTDMDRRNYQLETINAQLVKLYIECLTDWKKILKPGGRVVIVLPSFVIRAYLPKIIVNTNLVKTVIDKAKVMGYSFQAGPFGYFRPQAIVRRNICIFSYGTH